MRDIGGEFLLGLHHLFDLVEEAVEILCELADVIALTDPTEILEKIDLQANAE